MLYTLLWRLKKEQRILSSSGKERPRSRQAVKTSSKWGLGVMKVLQRLMRDHTGGAVLSKIKDGLIGTGDV